MSKAYAKAVAARKAIAASGVKENDTVFYVQRPYTYLGVSTGGLMKIRPVAGGRIITVNPLGVFFNDKPVQVLQGT